jgi:large subunit ribosomal protein L25
MKSVPLNAFPRQATRHGEVKKLRTTGRVPAVVYGRHTKPANLELNGVEIRNLIQHSASENVLVDLAVQNDTTAKRLALVQDVQHHPLSGAILHVDFHEVAENEKVTISVPVEPTGEAAGVKTGGGVLEHVLFKIKVCALPKDLPESILVDVSALEIGKSIHLSEITPPAGVEFFGEKKAVVFSVAAPITEAEETAAAAAATTTGEVEMIKEKKEDGTAAPAAGDKKGDGKAPAAAADKKGEKKEEKKK